MKNILAQIFCLHKIPTQIWENQMMAIPTASSANEALSLVGRVTDLVKKGATIELQETIVHLREAILAIKEENLDLKERISSLQMTLDRRQNLSFEAPNYYLIKEDGEKTGRSVKYATIAMQN